MLPDHVTPNNLGEEVVDNSIPQKMIWSFLIFRRGVGRPPITDIKVVEINKCEELQVRGYKPCPIEITNPEVALCYNRGNGYPVSNITVYRGQNMPPKKRISCLKYNC